MFAGKDVRIFLKGQAKDRFAELEVRQEKDVKSILESITRMKGNLSANPQFGDPIKKDRIPKEFVKLDIRNLYRIELANYWRALYTLEGTETEIYVFVLAIMDHKEYNRLFGYD